LSSAKPCTLNAASITRNKAKLLVCYNLAKNHPQQLLMVDPSRYHVIRNEDDDLLMAEAARGVERAACRLTRLPFKPNDLKGEALFRHIVESHLNDATAKNHTPRMYLNVDHSEAQVKEFGPDVKDLRKCSESAAS
jgi:hypothetical protein